MNKVWAIIKKDIITELRTKELFSSMLVFALLVIVIFNFAFGFSAELLDLAAPAMLWISFTFAGVLGLSRSFALEKEGDAIIGMLLTPTDRSLIYAGKMISNTIFVFLVGLLMVPMFILFFNYNFLSTLVPLIPVIFLGSIGFVSVGTLFSAMALNTKLREVMLPILLFPIIIPVIVSAVKLSEQVLDGNSLLAASFSLKLLVSFDIIFLTACAVIFEYVIDES
ncbi:MAG: heme exporter protein CcmB [Deltaproteobacteria bacterium]|nr:heme exporter protein CcmB [Deltaproteobacteria bacterium]MCK5709464.1 heme exporter protein CcmB [Deltaproteobacteria bacterium]